MDEKHVGSADGPKISDKQRIIFITSNKMLKALLTEWKGEQGDAWAIVSSQVGYNVPT